MSMDYRRWTIRPRRRWVFVIALVFASLAAVVSADLAKDSGGKARTTASGTLQVYDTTAGTPVPPDEQISQSENLGQGVTVGPPPQGSAPAISQAQAEQAAAATGISAGAGGATVYPKVLYGVMSDSQVTPVPGGASGPGGSGSLGSSSGSANPAPIYQNVPVWMVEYDHVLVPASHGYSPRQPTSTLPPPTQSDYTNLYVFVNAQSGQYFMGITGGTGT